jgi:hypothetical protein
VLPGSPAEDLEELADQPDDLVGGHGERASSRPIGLVQSTKSTSSLRSSLRFELDSSPTDPPRSRSTLFGSARPAESESLQVDCLLQGLLCSGSAWHTSLRVTYMK